MVAPADAVGHHPAVVVKALLETPPCAESNFQTLKLELPGWTNTSEPVIGTWFENLQTSIYCRVRSSAMPSPGDTYQENVGITLTSQEVQLPI